ncbi:hypothetical protein GCM10010435_24560 [Winogradskya consettensis]|uniref:Cytochrome C biogenesis protein transmembrane region n=1 Tax=Winogradskya consettensis TaxID=113560 RepID=A0A919T2I5_9ACTN|nr:hypothetical protein [Actinoplanes consettensis]GIM82494.1 hypothetical protein Aco04nite_81880 [Actinoplanes consettensis]
MAITQQDPSATAPARATDRTRPSRPWLVAGLGAAAGVLLSVLWSFELVDSVIGDTVAKGLLGSDAKADQITGTAAGLLFAFVSGLAGTFTACNIAMAASVGPLAQAGGGIAAGSRSQIRAMLRPVGHLVAGMVTVSATYGFAGVLLGDRLPQLSTEVVGGVPVRLIQSSVVFGVIGLALIYIGLAALKVVPDVFADRPVARVITLGALIGGFLIGRPYPLFNKLFHWAVDNGNPLYGAAAFVLQSLGNVLIVLVLFVLLTALSRGAFLRAMLATPTRAMVVTGSLMVALGVFTVVYWDVRLPAMFGHGWFPVMFYNN